MTSIITQVIDAHSKRELLMQVRSPDVLKTDSQMKSVVRGPFGSQHYWKVQATPRQTHNKFQ